MTTHKDYFPVCRLDGTYNAGCKWMNGPFALSLQTSPPPADGGTLTVVFIPDGTNVPTLPDSWINFGGRSYSQDHWCQLSLEYQAVPGSVLYTWLYVKDVASSAPAPTPAPAPSPTPAPSPAPTPAPAPAPAPAASTDYLRMSHFGGSATEVGSGPYGVASSSYGSASVANLKMGAGLACSFVFRLDALTPATLGNNFDLILDPVDNSPSAGNSGARDLLDLASAQTFYSAGGSTFGYLAVTPAAGHMFQFVKAAGATPTITCSVSTNGGTSWSTVGTVTGSNIDYFIKSFVNGSTGQPTQITFLSQTGLVAV